jgi:hypothetical protein
LSASGLNSVRGKFDLTSAKTLKPKPLSASLFSANRFGCSASFSAIIFLTTRLLRSIVMSLIFL